MRWLIASAVVLVTSPAWADDNEEAAKQEFEAGQASERAGRADEACRHFRSALQRLRVSGPLDRAAKCDAAEGHYLDAIRKEDELLRSLPPDHPDRAGYDASRSEWRKKVAHLVLSTKPGGDAFTIAIDGVRAQTLDAPLDLDPGKHEVRVERAGRPPSAKQVDVAAGATLEVPVPFDDRSVQTHSEGVSGASPWLIGGAIGLGVGGVAAVVAGVTGGLILAHKSRADEVCPGAVGSVSCRNEVDAGEALFAPNLAMWIVGAVGVAAGVTFLIVDRVTTPASPSNRNKASASPAKLIVTLRPTGMAFTATF